MVVFMKDGLLFVKFGYWVARELKIQAKVHTNEEPSDPSVLNWKKKI